MTESEADLHAGQTELEANALSSVGGWIGMVVICSFGYLSDKLTLRGPIVIISLTIYLVLWIVFQQYSASPDRWLKYGLMVTTQGFTLCFHVSLVKP